MGNNRKLKRFVLFHVVNDEELDLDSFDTLDEVETEMTNLCESYDWEPEYLEDDQFVIIDMLEQEKLEFNIKTKVVLEPTKKVVLDRD